MTAGSGAWCQHPGYQSGLSESIRPAVGAGADPVRERGVGTTSARADPALAGVDPHEAVVTLRQLFEMVGGGQLFVGNACDGDLEVVELVDREQRFALGVEEPEPADV